MNKNRTPIGGRTCKAWRLRKKHNKALTAALHILDIIARHEIPLFMQKMAKEQIGHFRPPIFDLIRKSK